MEKEFYNKPKVTTENVEIGTYGRYDCAPPNCTVIGEAVCGLE